jgi:hypothetical protein
MKKQLLGVDIGNVIINHRLTDNDDETLHEERYSTIPAALGVYESLKKLNDEKFSDGIFLISKCTPWAELKILAWLKDNDFYQRTGVKPDKVVFCRERRDKETICMQNNITYFIDDRLEVLSDLVGKVPHLFLYQPDQAEIDEYRQFLPKVTIVKDWADVLKKMI